MSHIRSSEHKFVSNCGWPSFFMALGTVDGDESPSNILRKEDTSHGMTRTEVCCKQVRAVCHKHHSLSCFHLSVE